MKLLALCAQNRNSKAAATCQALLEMADAEKALFRASTRNDVKLKTALVYFIHNVFIDTPLVDRKLAERRDTFQLLGFVNDELNFVLEHLDAQDNFGQDADIYFEAPKSSRKLGQKRTSTNDNKLLTNFAHSVTDVSSADDSSLKDYMLGLVHLIRSLLLVATTGEIRMKFGNKILSEVRKSLRGRAVPFRNSTKDHDEMCISAMYQKCIDTLDQRSEDEGALVGHFQLGLLNVSEEDENPEDKDEIGAGENVDENGKIIELGRAQSKWWTTGGAMTANIMPKMTGSVESFDEILARVIKELKTSERALNTIRRYVRTSDEALVLLYVTSP